MVSPVVAPTPPPRKIRVAFNASCLVTNQRSGVAQYTWGLITNLSEQYGDRIELVGHYCNFAGRQQFDLPRAANISYRPTKLLSSRVLNLLRRLGLWIPFELLVKGRADFHLFPAFIGWPSLHKTPSAPVIHDITYLDFPQYVSNRARHDMQRFVPKAIRRAAFVITITRSSEAGLRKHFALGDKPVLITYIPPVGLMTVPGKRATQLIVDLKIQGDYVLFFGTLEPRKNLVGLLSAYEMLPAQLREQYALVLAGGQGWHDEAIVQKLAALQAAGLRIYQTGYVSDEQRAALFQNATAFVLPSFYEGFGMPLLEAMTYRAPILVSKIAALREVAGEAALYCDPNDAADISAQLAKMLGSANLRDQLVQSGSRRLKDFSWQDVSQNLYDQIMKVVTP